MLMLMMTKIMVQLQMHTGFEQFVNDPPINVLFRLYI